jgi:hypothetical protein
MAMLAPQAITTPVKWRYQSGVCYFVQELAVLHNEKEKKEIWLPLTQWYRIN